MRVILLLFFIPCICGFSAHQSYQFLDEVEGTKLKAYPDGGGWAICKGNNFNIDGTRVQKGDIATLKKCNAMRNHHVIKRVMPKMYGIDFSDNKMIAIVSYVYRHGGYGSKGLRKCARKQNFKCVERYLNIQIDVPRRVKKELNMWRKV